MGRRAGRFHLSEHAKELWKFFLPPLFYGGMGIIGALGFGAITSPGSRLTSLETTVTSMSLAIAADNRHNGQIQDSLLRLAKRSDERNEVMTQLWCQAFKQAPTLEQLANYICADVITRLEQGRLK